MKLNQSVYQRICAIAEDASQIPAQERESHLLQACGRDSELLQYVQQHLEAMLQNATDPLLADPPDEPTVAWVDGDAVTAGVQDTQALPREAPQPATRLGEFQIRRTLGAGGMGQVFLAHHPKLQRFVAIKSVHRHLLSQPALRERFHREAQAAARLQHPHIVSVFELGADADTDFIVMEHIDGQDLEAAGRQSPANAARIAMQIAEAIQYAHEHGVVHRDLKPGNILLDQKQLPHVTDFGLAMLLDADHRLTVDEAILGTPSYMAPEQADPQQAVGASADIYAVGGILYFMLTGRAPFLAATPLATLQLVMGAEAKFPANDETPRDLTTICLKCLYKSPGRRYLTARALAEDLQAYLDGRPIAARQVGRAERTWMWIKRHPAASLSLALCATIALAVPLLRSKFQSLGEAAADAVATADEQTQAAAKSESRAQAAETLVQREQYADLIQQAHEQLLLGNRRMANDLLDLCEVDDRGWEWHYLKSESGASSLLTSVGTCAATTITPDGAWAIASFAGRILGWETETRTRVLQITPAQNGSAIALSASSQQMLAGLFPNSIQCWDLLTGDPIGSWPLDNESGEHEFRHPGQIQFNQQGDTLFLARTNIVSAWEPRSQERLWKSTSLQTIDHLSVSSDNLLVAVAGEDANGPAVHILDATLGERIETLHTESKILGVQLSHTAANDTLIVTLHEDRLRFHTLEPAANSIDFGAATAAPAIPNPTEPVREIEQVGALCLAQGSNDHIVVGASQGLRIYDPIHRRLIHDLRGGSATQAAISQGTRPFTAVARDEINRPYLWRPNGVHCVPEQLGWLKGAFDASLEGFAATSLGKFHWALLDAGESYRQQASLQLPLHYVGRSHGRKAMVKSWNPQGASPQVAIDISADGNMVATADRTLNVWPQLANNQDTPAPWTADLGSTAQGLAIHADGNVLAVATDNDVQLWDISRRRKLQTLREPGGFALAFSPDRSLLAVSRHIRTIMADIGASAKETQKLDATIVSVFELSSGERIHTFKAANVFDVPSCVTFSPDGSLLCAGLCSGVVRSWDLARGEALADLRVGESVCLGVAFTPDSKRMATASAKETLIWDVTTRRRLLALAYDSGMTNQTVGYSQLMVPPVAMAAWGANSRELQETPAIVWTNAARSQLQFSADGQRLGIWSPFGRHFWNAGAVEETNTPAPNNPFLSESSR